MRDLSKRIPIRGRGYRVAYQTCGPILCNMYALICDATGEAAIIDPSCETSKDWDQLESYLGNRGGGRRKIHSTPTTHTDVKHIFLTHGHADHVLGLSEAMARWPRASVYLHPLEEENYRQAESLGKQYGIEIPGSLPTPTDELHDGDTVSVGEKIQLRVVHTPGHSPGHVVFADSLPNGHDSANAGKARDDGSSQSMAHSNGAVIFSGDLLFRGTVGHTEMHNASFADLSSSLCRLYDVFHGDSIVLSGHTTPTYMKTEKESNRYVISALNRPSNFLEEARQRHGWKFR